MQHLNVSKLIYTENIEIVNLIHFSRIINVRIKSEKCEKKIEAEYIILFAPIRKGTQKIIQRLKNKFVRVKSRRELQPLHKETDRYPQKPSLSLANKKEKPSVKLTLSQWKRRKKEEEKPAHIKWRKRPMTCCSNYY